jgi:hypothetical protein
VNGLPLACAVIFVATAGGTSATYVDRGRTPLPVRAAAGACLGFVFLGVAGLLLSLHAGLTAATVVWAAVAAGSPSLFLLRPSVRTRLAADAAAARQRIASALHGSDRRGLAAGAALALAAALLLAAFRQTIVESAAGIETRAFANRQDLTLHLGIILSFLKGANFPPVHPEFSGAPLTYPFLGDLAAALLVKAAATLEQALRLQSMILLVALIVLAYTGRGCSPAAAPPPR